MNNQTVTRLKLIEANDLYTKLIAKYPKIENVVSRKAFLDNASGSNGKK